MTIDRVVLAFGGGMIVFSLGSALARRVDHSVHVSLARVPSGPPRRDARGAHGLI